MEFEGNILIPGNEDTLAPGVKGYIIDKGAEMYVPIILAENPGSGEVSKYLDSLNPNFTWKFPCVLSLRLKEMLERRGFKSEFEWCKDTQEHIDVLVRRSTP